MTKPGDPKRPTGDDPALSRLERALKAAEALIKDQEQRLKSLGVGREESMRALADVRDELKRVARERDELRKQLSRDRTKITVSGFTQLGLVEMTRKRTRESLAHMLCEGCPTCEGKGQVKTPRSVCYDILREILREARQFNPKEFRVIASAAVWLRRRARPAG